MSENYKFFQHTTCEYFPCHNLKNEDAFNCLFCFCPLYVLNDRCGGNFKYTNGIKDCSECTLPHSKNAHEFIMSKMSELIKIGSEKN